MKLHNIAPQDAPVLPATIPLNPVLRKQFDAYAERLRELSMAQRSLQDVIQGAATAALAAMGIPEDSPYGINLDDLDAGFFLKGAPEAPEPAILPAPEEYELLEEPEPLETPAEPEVIE